MPSLIPSSRDKVAFTKELWPRFEKTLSLMERKRGIVVIPPEVESALKPARKIYLRHRQGDFRHTDGEMRSEQVVARWLVETWAHLNGQPVPKINFGPHN